ncbi:Protein of unknown function [Thalassovita litoralis]|uniref:DUF3800 domain-containing protein n=1 Tax=Thalassovita litoralis TaxID=1010611 RepID=A0A521CJR3_9RHOB|nr:DUF3800 domain-containing protein [Thalassovita litoralis]SMO59709.1 Protein of unknown function [Thalassovita litoralis]
MALDVLHYYCDCSSYAGDNKYAVVGGIAVKAHMVDLLNGKVQSLKDGIGMQSEFKWSEYRGGRKKATYEALVDLFYEAIDLHYMHFHAIIVDFNEFDHHKKGRGAPQLSVNKMYYQLMLHEVCRRYGSKWRIVMFPDHGPDSDQIGDYRNGICARAYKMYSAKPNCLREIHPTASKKVGLLQMTDVIIGAMAAHREDRTVKAVKSDLREYVMAKSPITDLSTDTPRDERQFSIWNFNC